MGRRRYRYREREDDPGLASLVMDVAFASPVAGAILVAVFVIGAALCFAYPKSMLGIAPMVGYFSLFTAGVTALFTLAGIVTRWIRGLSAPTRDLYQPSPRGYSPPGPPAAVSATPYAPAVPLKPMRDASLLSRGEMAFFDPLRDVVGDRYEIMLKPSLVDVLGCRNDPRFRRIAAMHVDFLLCDRQTLAPVLAIELDDRSHRRRGRSKTDLWKEQLLAERRIPLLRQPCEPAYDVLALRDTLHRATAHAPPSPRPAQPGSPTR